MKVVGWEELQLTVEEARGVLRLQRRLKLSKETIQRLHEKTEGWAAGLILMTEKTETERLAPQSFSEAAPEALFDYFAGEIFHKEALDTQQFLLKTAFLPRMTVRMAEALTNLQSSGRLLSDFARRRYFTNRHEHADPVYQYHPLFHEFLLSRAKRDLAPAELAQIQRDAARLLAEAEQPEEAVHLLCELGDWEKLSQVILKYASPLVAQGRTLTLQEWIGSLPSGRVERDAWLQYWLGMCTLPFGPAQSRQNFERAFALFKAQSDPAGLFQAWCSVVATFLYEWRDFAQLDPWIEELEDLLRQYPTVPFVEVETRVAANMFGALLFRRPQHPEIQRWAERAFALSQGSANLNRRMLTGFLLTLYHLWMGDLAKAAVIIDSLREAVHPQESSSLALLVWKGAEAYYYWQAGAPERSLRAVSDGLAIAQTSGIHMLDSELLGQGVYASLTAGDLTTAREFLHQMAAKLDNTRLADVTHYHFLAGWEAILWRDIPLAFQHVDACLSVTSGMSVPLAQNYLAMAQVLHEQAEERKAATWLAKARQIGHQVRSRMLDYMSLLAEAQFALDAGKEAHGLQVLRHAMVLGRQQGFVTTPWWRPSVMARLCMKALEAGIEVEYVQALVRKCNLVPDVPPLAVENWPWPIRIVTLGEFSLEKDGQPVRFSGKVQQRPLAMLKAIVAFGGQGVAAEQLTDALWPEADGDVGHQSFATTLHRLRQLVGHEQAILLQGGQVSLDARYCWVDTWAFERLLEQADAAEGKGRLDQAVELSEKALALYKGPFLYNDTKASWALLLRERLRNKFLRYSNKLGQRWEQAGEWRRAIESYEKGLDVDGLAEEFYQRQMVCYERLGRRAEALAVY